MEYGVNSLNSVPSVPPRSHSSIHLPKTDRYITEIAPKGLFKGEIAQVRVWSSPCSESSLQRLIGRSGVLDADDILVCLWKVDEGTGPILRNSRPLQPPKAPRGSKAVVGVADGTGAEGHAELRGRWSWVSCFDPADYESFFACSNDGDGEPSGAPTGCLC